MDVCVAFGDTGAFDLRVSGFGGERWPVDVATDLATILVQLPEALAASSHGQALSLNFFEQGTFLHAFDERAGLRGAPESAARASRTTGQVDLEVRALLLAPTTPLRQGSHVRTCRRHLRTRWNIAPRRSQVPRGSRYPLASQRKRTPGRAE